MPQVAQLPFSRPQQVPGLSDPCVPADPASSYTHCPQGYLGATSWSGVIILLTRPSQPGPATEASHHSLPVGHVPGREQWTHNQAVAPNSSSSNPDTGHSSSSSALMLAWGGGCKAAGGIHKPVAPWCRPTPRDWFLISLVHSSRKVNGMAFPTPELN